VADIEDVLRRQQHIIDTVGWAVTYVLPLAADPDMATPFGYTVGLTARFTDLILSDRFVRTRTS
jgi:hypothetical protein